MNWRDYSVEKPYDYRSNSGLEEDPQYCWFVFRHTHRPETMNSGPFLSHAPCAYIDGIFKGYEPHMKTRKYPTDRIEVLFWCDAKEVESMIFRDCMNQQSTKEK